jgi:hypothetical protein
VELQDTSQDMIVKQAAEVSGVAGHKAGHDVNQAAEVSGAAAHKEGHDCKAGCRGELSCRTRCRG